MKRLLLALLGLPLLAAAGTDARGVLTIDVGNVRIAKGNVHVDVCPEAQFLKDNCPWTGNARARLGDTRVTVTNLPAGRYAVQAFLDENGNGEVDRALFGIPKEGVGFSNDAKIRLGPPKFAEAVFAFDGNARTIRLTLRYFMGAQGPSAR
ncbi:DUF2141 domain-containing protein [Sphingomonas asaccharolytica]|uniref:DUF2141 domain-containing protein n=1 Tax=Sphingomonas asaccharolytica TaxID=40681 RepID=UPI00082A8227|nr:DUF2141 domain-containing protein [Sphingomonas asaccharolytica]